MNDSDRTSSPSGETGSEASTASSSGDPSHPLQRPRIGFLGTGWIGRHRMEAIHRSGMAEVAVIHDPAPEAARDALNRARSKVQALRVAKSTFFAVAELSGTVVRNDLPTDMMAGKNLFEPFPDLKGAVTTGYAEATGVMPEARGVEGKQDGQWTAAAAVKLNDQAKGLYVTGWAWTLYARRLEEALKSRLYDEEKGKKPLFYVVVVVGDQAYGTGPTPQVNLDRVMELAPATNAKDDHFQAQLEITGRDFGFAAQRAEALGRDVMVGVLRSET